MFDILKLFSLQLFGEGGDGGDGSPDGDAGETSGVEIPSSVPERARKMYSDAVKKHSSGRMTEAQQPVETPADNTEEPVKPTYEELIKGEYKEAHKEYMDRTISERFKKYKGIEATTSEQAQLLSLVAQKYGLDVNSTTYMQDLKNSIEADDSYYEKIALDRDMSPQEARRVVTLERKVAENEARQKREAEEQARREQFEIILRNAEETAKVFPGFNLEEELKNEKFGRALASVQGDTTTAYKIVHWNELQHQMVQTVTQNAVKQASNAVKSNKARPVENGMNAQASSVQTVTDFRGYNLSEIRAQANAWRSGKR